MAEVINSKVEWHLRSSRFGNPGRDLLPAASWGYPPDSRLAPPDVWHETDEVRTGTIAAFDIAAAEVVVGNSNGTFSIVPLVCLKRLSFEKPVKRETGWTDLVRFLLTAGPMTFKRLVDEVSAARGCPIDTARLRVNSVITTAKDMERIAGGIVQIKKK